MSTITPEKPASPSLPVKAGSKNIVSVLKEKRIFKPSAKFAKNARIGTFKKYRKLYKASLKSPDKFWGKAANEELTWFRTWKKVCVWKPPFAEWFVGGKLNASVNCIDRHLQGPLRNKAAIIFEGEPGDVVTLTYQQLHREVCLVANVLKKHGVKPGDRVMIYLPMIPEAVITMLACARIGAPHSVVFSGFSAEALKERINDCGAKVIVTADGGFRRGTALAIKRNVDEALLGAPKVKSVLVVQRTKQEIVMTPGRDYWLHEETPQVSAVCRPEVLDSEHPLFILYTSGSTGKPKGILHTTAGYLLGSHLTTKVVFDLCPEDVYFCTADVGWVTGHTYVVYGVLSNGGTSLIYEGAPNYPEPDRYWRIIDRHKVNIFYTAPTAIRSFIKWGDDWVAPHDLSSLRLLGSVGEPINPEAWMWYYEKIGGRRCPIVDTWWQTETGAHMITPLPGVTPLKPGSATLPFFGVDAAVVDDDGNETPPNTGGKLVIRRPWPSMLRSIYGDATRYRKTYWSEVKGCYFAGDGARRDKDGYFWIVGRIDDVLNVAGHRLGTSEVESALVSHPDIAEAAVVGRPDDLKGQALVAFVTLKNGVLPGTALKDTLRAHVGKEIGALAKPDDIRFAEGLPKTRSGKIMRRLLKEVAASPGAEIKGDTTTLEDLNVLAKLRHVEE
ncbi:MAG TPA: acetate--CoA ligase [Candidatus Methylacidiphilales bacterium]|nr:acetate--CoA ligase [Candidatus Methylacidiphilales bacterium]